MMLHEPSSAAGVNLGQSAGVEHADPDREHCHQLVDG
jgi:hypothetical protein